MIQKIIEHKIRNGILAFLFGLFVVVGALYIDVFRGGMSSTIGLYQIVGALTGYIISGIGATLVIKGTKVRKALQNILLYSGTIVAAISIFAEHLGVAGPSGFDKFQIVGLIVGLVILGFGVFVLPKRLFDTLHYVFSGDATSFRFRGTQFILSYTQDTNRSIYDVYVDGSKIATINADGASQRRKNYTSPIFSAGTHLVQLKKIGGGGGIMDVDTIQALDTAAPGAGTYDDTHFNWSYKGSWAIFSASGPLTETLHYTLSAGDTASFRFSGRQFILTYTQDTNRANYDVYVDGSKITTIDANGSLQWQKTYASPIFSAGIHLLEIKNAGGGGDVMDIDAIEIN